MKLLCYLSQDILTPFLFSQIISVFKYNLSHLKQDNQICANQLIFFQTKQI